MRNTSDSDLVSAHSHAGRERLLSLLLSADRERRRGSRTIAARGKWDGPIPLSYAQERLWFLDQLGAGAAYNMSMAARLQGGLNVEVLESSFAELVRRHESLRTRFEARDGVPHQLIDPPGSVSLDRVDLSHVADPQQREQQLCERMQREQLHRFDLSEGPLFRVVLVRLDASEHALLLAMHHIVSDGWSSEVLLRELSTLYASYIRGQPSPLPELALQYADYAIWQRQWLQGEVLQEQLQYWREQLLGAPPALELPTDRPRPAVESFKGATLRIELPTTLSGALKELWQREGVTLFMVSLAAYQVLLARWSGQQDIVVGSPIAGRGNQQIEGLIGSFVNTLALRTDVSGDLTFRQLLARVKEVTLGAYAHQDLPFEALVKELRPERNLTRQPIFQVSLLLQNYPEEHLELSGLTGTFIDAGWVIAHFDLSLYLYEHSHGLSAVFEYATDLFDKETIERMAGHFRTLLERIVVDPDCPIHQLPLLSEAEKQRLLVQWNQTAAKYPHEKCLHELFEEQVERAPRAIAVVYEGQSLTYAELNGRANQLARHLRNKGIGPDQLVAICVERSVDMFVGLLGILKAGGAYVPLDPNYPTQRLQYMFRDAAPRVLLTHERLREALPDTTAEVITLDNDWSEIARQPSSNLEARALGLRFDHLAYVIYTSGSTGHPKGVMVKHAGVVNLLSSMKQNPGIRATDRMLGITTMSFDMAVPELYLPLISGARLVLASREMASDARLLMAMLDQFDITVLQATPATWQLLLSGGWKGRSNLKALCGAEALNTDLSGKLVSRVGALWNLYGPTETTVWSCRRPIAAPGEHGAVESIGRAIANTQIYILDRHLQPVPIGVAGEIHIGGVGVGRGYLNRPELTAERFIADPFSPDRQARLYKTGDLGRWRSDAMIEYVGRNDHQVKIRGFRIELGEIEARLARHAQVKEAVVIAREDVPGEKRLVAYIVQRESAASVEDLRAYLKTALLEYMVPSAFVTLKSLPLTPNGKLDRRALPAPELAAYTSQEYEAPRGEVEEVLAGIWQELLHVERVGRQDNFFELGGHSLLATRVITRISHVLDIDLPLRVIFEKPTIEGLSSWMVQDLAADLSMEAL